MAPEGTAQRLRDSAWLERLVGSLTIEFSETEGWIGPSLPLTARYLRRTTDSLRSGRYTSSPGTKAEPTRRNAVLTARIPFRKGRSALRPDGKSRRPGRSTDPSGTHTIVAEIDDDAA